MADTYSDLLPSYMIAADIHSVANGKESLTDDYNTFDHITKGSLSVIARGVTSAFNMVPAATNWAGLTDVPEWQTEDLIRSFDNDLAAYYSDNREVVDVVGDIAASFIPGMAAVKGLNYAQKGLAGLQRGSAGKNILQSIGALPTRGDELVQQAVAKIGGGNTFSLIDQSVLKAFGTKYAQNALEAGVFELAAASTMSDFSPLFKDHTASDILYNSALGGGIIGGGLLGTVSAVQTYGVVRRAKDVVDKALNPFRRIAETPEGVDEFVKILNWKSQLDNPPVAVDDAAKRALETRQRNLGLHMQESFTTLAGGDAELGSSMYKSIQNLNKDQAWAALLHMDETGRAASVLKAEAKLEAVAGLRVQQGRLKQGSEDWFKIEAKIEELGEATSIKFLSLADGSVSHTPPPVMNLADKFSKAEIDSILKKSFIKPNEAWSPIGKTTDEIEARYIVASMQKMEDGVFIGGNDLPMLEAAWNKGLTQVGIDGIQYDRMGLWYHIQTKKESLLGDMVAMLDVDPAASSQKIAKSLNIKLGMVEGGGYDALDTAAYIAKSDFAETYAQPSVIKIAYKGDPAKVGVSGNELQGMVTIKELQALQESTNLQALSKVLGEENLSQLIKLTDRDVLSSTSAGAGAGLLSLASGEYQTTASKVEWLGKVTNRLKVEKQKAINDSFQPLMHSILQNVDASNELVTLRQQILSTGEKYVWKDGEVVHASIARYETAIENGSKRAVKPQLGAGVAERLSLQQPESVRFMDEWIRINNEHIANDKLLRNAVGKGMGNYEDVIHFPQPDSSKFKFFSFVVPKNPAEGEKVQMIWAANAEALAALESKVDSNYSILHKTDTDRFYQVQKQYDYDLGFNSTQVREDLKRSGVAAPFFPITDPQALLQDMLNYRHKQSDRQVRDAVSLHNSVAFSEFRRLDSEYTAIQKSSKKVENVDSPFESYVKTALDIPRSSHVPVWTEFNNMAENVYSKAASKLGDAWKKLRSPADLAETKRVMDEAGVRGYTDAFIDLFANHPADRKLLSEHVMTANSILSTTILRLDPMNAVNNGLGSNILLGSETSSLLTKMKAAGTDLSSLMVGVPGTKGQILSPIKLISSANKDFFGMLAGDQKMVALKAQYEKMGWMPSYVDQLKSVADGATLTGIETSSELALKTKQMIKGAAEMGEKLTGNKMAEEMNRFIAARVAHSISDLAVGSGNMSKSEQLAFINTFVNRTQGNYLASQRPLMFQGPVGHAISLFQTYSFNMMQHVFRHVANGEKKQLAILLGLQTSMYGMNGLPAFSFLNQFLVGNAAGNLEHEDAYSFLRRGGDVGNWLLYGSLSNATGLGIYSRGDLNPRHLTVLPTDVADVPFISATRNVFGALSMAGGEIAGGADVGSTILRGLEHSGISRPLAGLATTLQGVGSEDGISYSTSTKNQLMTTWDTYSMASLSRIAGARPYDEAVTRDAYYRVQSYEAKDQSKVNKLGSVIRDRVRSGNIPSEEEYDQFLESYVRSGGDQKGFIKFWQKQVKDADRSQVDKMVEHSKSRYSNYLQTMMGGYDPTVEGAE